MIHRIDEETLIEHLRAPAPRFGICVCPRWPLRNVGQVVSQKSGKDDQGNQLITTLPLMDNKIAAEDDAKHEPCQGTTCMHAMTDCLHLISQHI